MDTQEEIVIGQGNALRRIWVRLDRNREERIDKVMAELELIT